MVSTTCSIVISDSNSCPTHSLHRRFDLPYLTKLYIWDTVHVCTHVLHAIGSSPDVVIEISIDLYRKEACNKDISNVFSALSTHMNRRADPYSSLFLDPFHGDSNTTFSLARHATSATHSIDSPRHYSGLDGPTLEECLSVEIVRDPDVEGGNMPDAPLIMELAFSSSVPIVDKIDTVAVAEFASEDILDWDIWRTLRQLYNVRYLRTSSFEAVRHLHSPFFPEIDFDDPVLHVISTLLGLPIWNSIMWISRKTIPQWTENWWACWSTERDCDHRSRR